MKEGAEASIAKYDGEWNVQSLAKESLTGNLSLFLYVFVNISVSNPFHFYTNPLIRFHKTYDFIML